MITIVLIDLIFLLFLFVGSKLSYVEKTLDLFCERGFADGKGVAPRFTGVDQISLHEPIVQSSPRQIDRVHIIFVKDLCTFAC